MAVKCGTPSPHFREHGAKPDMLYDFECCFSIEEFRQTMRQINDCGYSLISVASLEGAALVIFQRSAYG